MVSLAVHNPAQLADDDVRHRFVVRSQELAELLVHLREGDPPRHALVIGARGMGKSLLLRRVAITVADEPDLSARWLPVLMPEELYQVTTIGELWLAALAQLATAGGDSALAERHRALLGEPDPARLEALARESLLGAARASGRKVLLLVENLDMLLGDQAGRAEAWVLRQALQTEPGILLMASAVSSFTLLEASDEAFYGFFHRIDLRPLDDAEVRTLWHQVTGVDVPVERAAAVRILTGGNPRLTAVMGRFSEHPDLSELRADLDLLIDEYTPFFKANIEALPPGERKVFATLADIWAPASAAEVAERARMTSSQISANLNRLIRRGAVEIVDGIPGPNRYELTERLYNLYHLLRRPDGEGRVRALVDILTHLYDADRLEREVFPAIVRSADAAASPVDTLVASRLERHFETFDPWSALSTADATVRVVTLEKLVALKTARFGPNDRETLNTRSNLALCTGRSGDRISALRQYQAVVIDLERVLGADDRDTLTARSQVAYYTGTSGDTAGALALYRQVAADSERVLGADDRATLISRHGLAWYLGETGDHAGGLEVAEDVCGRAERVLEPADDLIASARWSRDRLAREVLLATEGPQPREVREVGRLLRRRPAAAPPPPI